MSVATKPTTSKKPSKGEVTRQKLVAAAAQIFNTSGYFNTDTNRIAREAGYAPGTFYKHFDNKLDIFLAAYERWVANEWDDIRVEASKTKVDPRSLKRIYRLILKHHKDWVGFRSDLRALAATNDRVRIYQAELRASQIEMLAKMDGNEVPSKRDRSRYLFILLTVERVCDAIADGTAKLSGAREDELFEFMVQTARENLSSL